MRYLLLAGCLVTGTPAAAQRAGDNAIAGAGDAFGRSIGNEFLRANLDYRLPFIPGVSADFGLVNNGERIASASNLLKTPARTIVEVGGRYRFKVNTTPATFRIQMTNVFGTKGWNVSSSGGLQQILPRRLVANLAMDF